MGDLVRDLRFAFRMLTKSPGVSAIAVLTIALGVGLTTHTFSIVYGSVIRGLPYEGADRLMYLTQTKPIDGISDWWVPLHDYLDWRDQQTTFEGLAALYSGTVNLADAEQRPERFLGSFVTWNTFAQAGARPIVGRGFREGDDRPGAPPTIVLSREVWENRYAADPDIVGTVVRANGTPHTVIGVMPEGFRFPFDSRVWLPLALDPAATERGEATRLLVFGRLAAGATRDGAAAELATIARRLEQEYPETNAGVGVAVRPYTEAYMPSQIVTVLWAMLVAVFGVLLIACANVANLLLARAITRSREVAIRSAMGATRATVVRQLLAESLVVAVIGGVVGIGISYVGIAIFNAALVDIEKPFWIDIALFPQVLIFAVAVTVAASVASGTLPALKASGTHVHEVLKDAARGSPGVGMSRFSTALVVGEIAVSGALLLAAGFMVKSIINVGNVELGFVPQNVFTARVGLNERDYPDDESRLRFHDELSERLAALPGVESVALTSNLPASGAGMYWFGVEGVPYVTDQDYPFANRSVITPGFFRTFGVQVHAGRDVAARDRAGELPVAVVNESFQRRHFPGESALGKRLRLGRSSSERPWLTIVGVVPDLHVGGGVGGIGSDARLQEHLYTPLAQGPLAFVSMAIRTTGDPLAIAPAVRDAVVGLDPNLPIYDVDSMEGVIETDTWAFGLFGSLFAIFGAIALFMAGVGLYGVMAFSVGRQRREMGIRMAVGAHAADIVRLVFRRGFVQLAIGTVVGVALGATLANPLRVVFFDVDTTDASVYVAILATLGVAGLLACLVPAKKAAGIDVMETLKQE